MSYFEIEKKTQFTAFSTHVYERSIKNNVLLIITITINNVITYECKRIVLFGVISVKLKKILHRYLNNVH